MSENPLAFGMVCVVVKLALCHVFQRVLFFVVYEGRVRSRKLKGLKKVVIQAERWIHPFPPTFIWPPPLSLCNNVDRP